MIYLELFLGFLSVGCFAFGGAYGAIPLARDMVLSHGWLTDEALTYIIAVSESTPGSIMVNLATYVGSTQGGILGALCATVAVVLPAFFVILLIVMVLKAAWNNKGVQSVLYGLNPCVIGIILATGIVFIINNIFTFGPMKITGIKEIILTVILGAIMFGSGPVFKKKPSPILLIIIAAVLGIIVYGI